MKATINFIGTVQSSLKDIKDCPLQEFENAPSAFIKIFPEFISAIADLKAGSEIVLLTWLHEADRNVLQCIRRKEYNTAKVGVFSTRSPDRPNPIGLHHVKIKSINTGTILLESLEALDGTPVIDIKPVI